MSGRRTQTSQPDRNERPPSLFDHGDVPPHKTAYDLVMEATPSVSGPPVDCTNACEYADCNCSGVSVVVGWRVDVPALRVLLAPQEDE